MYFVGVGAPLLACRNDIQCTSTVETEGLVSFFNTWMLNEVVGEENTNNGDRAGFFFNTWMLNEVVGGTPTTAVDISIRSTPFNIAWHDETQGQVREFKS